MKVVAGTEPKGGVGSPSRSEFRSANRTVRQAGSERRLHLLRRFGQGSLRFLFFWLLIAGAARAEINVSVPTDMGSGITIKMSSPVAAVPRFGFMPVRVSVENLTTAEGTWRFRFETGNARIFPGLGSSTFELAVPPARTREAWFYVPIVEPGISINPSALTAGLASGSPAVSATPPPIPGVYPDPKIPGVSHDIRSVVSSSGQAITRTFTITQIGPGAALPEIGSDRLPPGATSQVTRRASDGLFTRTTVVPVTARTLPSVSSPGLTAGASSPHPSVIALANARNELAKAGLNAAGARTSTSSRVETVRGGIQQVTVTLRQTGAASSLPVPPATALPPGFTAVNVMPSSADGSMVTREFTYVESFAATPPSLTVSSTASAFTTIRALGPAKSPSELEADARRVLASSKLLETPSGVTNAVSAHALPFTAVSGVPSAPVFGHFVMWFEQKGPASLLPQPSPNVLPAGVRVTSFPGATSGQVTRLISYVDPTLAAAIAASASVGGSGATGAAANVARLELQRSGFLRAQPGVTIAPHLTRTANTGSGPQEVIVFTETGPAALLQNPPPAALPAGAVCTVTPAAIPGEVARNFVVNVPTLLATVTSPVPLPARSGPTPARVSTGTMLNPATAQVEVVGPGVPRGGARAHFSNSISNTSMAPLATSPALEQVLRGKFSGTGARVAPNIAGVEPGLLPADWRIWSSFNSVLLKSEEFAALDPARRAALRSWVAMGGLLFLAPEATGVERTERVGAGRIETLAEALADMSGVEVFARLQIAATAPGMPERERMTLMAGTPMGDILTFDGADTLGISLLLILFALLIGPANVFFFAPAKKRHRLFFTTPALSVCGALALAVAIVLQDGFGGEGVRRTLVQFVPGESQAAVFQEQASRTGFLAQRDFTLDPGTMCSVLPADGNMFMAPGGGATFQRNEADASGDWFRNRSRQAHVVRALASTRARVEIVGAAVDGAPLVESTLAVELRDFRLRDAQGKIWSAATVPTGRRTTLRPESLFAAAATASLEAGGNGTSHLNSLLKEASTLTDPWQWVARGDAIDVAPIATLAAVRWKDDPIVYAGVATRAVGAGKGGGE